MKKKRIIIGLCAAGLLLLLAALTLLWHPDGSTYDRRAEKDFFALEMKPLNTSLSEPYALHQGGYHSGGNQPNRRRIVDCHRAGGSSARL